MATYYVYSGAGGAGTGADWANAYTTIANALSGKAAGDVFYIAHDHAESTAAAITLTFPGTIASPNKAICVNRSGSVPPVSADLRTTATISTPANVGNINVNGSVDWYGVTLNAGTGSTGANITLSANSTYCIQRYLNCSLVLNQTNSVGNINIGVDSTTSGKGVIILDNTPMTFGNIGHTIMVSTVLEWRNTPSALNGTVPNSVITYTTSNLRSPTIYIHGVDLSGAGSGKTLINGNPSITTDVMARVVDCKLNASVTKTTAPTAPCRATIDFVRCSSSGVNYSIHRQRVEGTLDEETTIVRTGGASDGTTPIAWKIVTSANVNWAFPFECPPIAVWNSVDGSAVTLTVEGIWGGGAVPNDDEIWVEVEYLGDNNSPQASFVNDSKADTLATAAGQSAGSGTWGGSTTKFKLNVTFTPQQAGWVYARVKAAKASSTFYIDPKATLS